MDEFVKKAEENLGEGTSNSPEWCQMLALRGIGYALLAVASAIAKRSEPVSKK